MEPLDLFDIIGPVMVGPSSSHTAGAIRLGRLARAAAGFAPAEATILLHGSFAETGRGHGTDRGLVAGLLGWAPDDARLPQVAACAAEAGLKVEFVRADLGRVHPNTARFLLVSAEGQRVEAQGSSTGGGAVVLTELNGWPVELSGLYHTLLVSHRDRPGALAGITGRLAAFGLNIATMRVARRSRGGEAMAMLELDQPPDDRVRAELEILTEVLWTRRVDRL
ncbi:MAG TPA: L-serine ammonia-lyase, iron-sulfur-dependent subunit beta [Symbiobacteriaceae bacterium]|nr:L-serine ammonia-lyase, iron-sulfur-dependent subunit beta [Symbiobacteriaceae bacterium]